MAKSISRSPTPVHSNTTTTKQHQKFRVRLSLPFLLSTFIISNLVAFGSGVVGYRFILKPLEINADDWNFFASLLPVQKNKFELQREGELGDLPTIKLPPGKRVPETVYTSKHFASPHVVTTIDEVIERGQDHQSYQVEPDGTASPVKKNDDEEDDEDEDIHQPTGQHLLVDIRNIDGSFLNSSARLASAMVKLVEKSGLTLLSYHCHGLQPVGVSCVGVLLESHISFHTWPRYGVISLDLFTCGTNPLLPLVPLIEELFAVPQPEEDSTPPRVLWVHKRRGFNSGEDRFNPESIDLNHHFLGNRGYVMKTHLASVQTDFQLVEFFDAINTRFSSISSYEQSLSNDGSYQSRHPELFALDRIVYLDGIMQSRRLGENAYHETLVHPALLCHKSPKRVAIVGGGEGATLREVLKHDTVEKVTMVEIDEGMVSSSRKYLPTWSDCSDIVSSTNSCFEEPRTEVFYTDAVAWFHERFNDAATINDDSKYDVIIMDALDPSAVVEFSDVLYDSNAVAKAFFNGLTDDGLFIAQVGEADYTQDTARGLSTSQHLDLFIEHLRSVGFESIKEFDEIHGNFMGPWNFLVAMKNSDSKAAWHANEAEISQKIHDRLRRSKSGQHPLKYFDGGSMMGYQFPSRIAEDVYCRASETPELCEKGHGFDPTISNARASQFEVTSSGVFFTKPYDTGSYVAIDDGVHSVMIMPSTLDLIESMAKQEYGSDLQSLDVYNHGYGFETDFYGVRSTALDPGKMMFVNHGCKGTNTMGINDPMLNEMAVDPDQMPDLASDVVESSVYSPFIDRNQFGLLNSMETINQDVAAGTELTANHLEYCTSAKWSKYVAELRTQCGATKE